MVSAFDPKLRRPREDLRDDVPERGVRVMSGSSNQLVPRRRSMRVAVAVGLEFFELHVTALKLRTTR
jgi:hypothetical protein